MDTTGRQGPAALLPVLSKKMSQTFAENATLKHLQNKVNHLYRTACLLETGRRVSLRK